MLLLKFLISSVLASFPLEGEGMDGWHSVEKKVVAEVGSDEEDSFIWALFVKNLGPETFQIRFPQDPTYRYSETKAMEISSEKDEVSYFLNIEERVGTPSIKEAYYESEGEWIRERIVQTDGYKYVLKVTSPVEDSALGEEFISSLSIEKNR
jgi:hypothetical protein